MEKFLKEFFKQEVFKKTKLLGDGGHREYWRIEGEKNSYILMCSGNKDPSLRHFLNVHRMFTKVSLPVPQIFHKDLNQGFLLLSDLGDISLEEMKKKKEAHIFYQQAIERLIQMQEGLPPYPHFPQFDAGFLMEETHLALKRLNRLAGSENQSLEAAFLKEMKSLSHRLNKLPQTYCHRDYHSRNLMVKGAELYILDFQDAGVGPFCYDLSSLLYDSYVHFENQERDQWMKFYFKNLSSSMKERVGDLRSLFFFTKLQFLQRGFKACGCFASFYNDNSRSSHLRFIEPSLLLLNQEAESLSQKGTVIFLKDLRQRLHQHFFKKRKKQ